jgi:RNA polymerase sigma-70 factor (ECF subfamily)
MESRSSPSVGGECAEASRKSPDVEADDRELIRRVAGGDRTALGLLYDRYAPIVLALGQKILRSRREAEDLLQDVFLEAWRQAGDYEPARGSVRTWIVLRARSRALDRCRNAWSRAVPLEDSAEKGEEGAVDPTLQADHERLRRVFVTLPEEQQKVLELGYFEGLSSSEIAERLGVPIGTVKSRVAAAMAKLRAALVREEVHQ